MNCISFLAHHTQAKNPSIAKPAQAIAVPRKNKAFAILSANTKGIAITAKTAEAANATSAANNDTTTDQTDTYSASNDAATAIKIESHIGDPTIINIIAGTLNRFPLTSRATSFRIDVSSVIRPAIVSASSRPAINVFSSAPS